MVSTRNRLLELLRSHPPITAIDLSRILQMTPANVRHHLAILREQGRVEVISERSILGRGRPRQLFRLTRTENNLDRLSDALLRQFLSPIAPQTTQADWQKIAISIAGVEVRSSGKLPQRLLDTVQRLCNLNYHAKWEAHAQGPRIILGHCPYLPIIENHPELCQMDRLIIEHMAKIPVIQLAKLEKNPRGESLCVFALGEEAKENQP